MKANADRLKPASGPLDPLIASDADKVDDGFDGYRFGFRPNKWWYAGPWVGSETGLRIADHDNAKHGYDLNYVGTTTGPHGGAVVVAYHAHRPDLVLFYDRQRYIDGCVRVPAILQGMGLLPYRALGLVERTYVNGAAGSYENIPWGLRVTSRDIDRLTPHTDNDVPTWARPYGAPIRP